MAIYLGNLSPKEIAYRVGFEMKQEDIDELESFRCENADVKFGQWHCFDIPFVCACGGVKAQQEFIRIIMKYGDEMKPSQQFDVGLAIDDREGIVRNV